MQNTKHTVALKIGNKYRSNEDFWASGISEHVKCLLNKNKCKTPGAKSLCGDRSERFTVIT